MRPGPAARAARAARGPQAHPGGAGLPRGAARPRPRPGRGAARGPGPGPLRPGRASAQRRAGARPAGQRGGHGGVTPPPATPEAALTAAYEALRAWAGGQPSPGPRPVGLALLLRAGLPAWLAMAGAGPAAAGPGEPARAGRAVGALAAHADLTVVLAAMVAASRQEEAP